MTEMPEVRMAPPPRWTAPSVLRGSFGLGIVGAVAWILGAVMGNPAQAFYSYLGAYVYVLGICLCALVLIVIEHLVGGMWFIVMRRIAEHVTAGLAAVAVLFLPIVAGVRWLYPWTNVAAMTPHVRSLVEQKTAYLNLPFFFVRAAIYFACWIGIAGLLRRWSFRQDEEPGERWQSPQDTLSAPGAILLAFTLTFAAFDWIMSLSPTWVSTIFGVQIFSSGMVGALALMCVLVGQSAQGGVLSDFVQPDHCSALGKMLFTFVIFWAYASFCQLLIIWIANVPEEVIWYEPRLTGSWLWVGVAVAIGQFAIPFFLLLSYRFKRRARALARLGAWLLAIHYAEIYWIVLPQLHPGSAVPHWQDAAALAMVVGLTAAWISWRAQGRASLAVGHPDLRSGLAYSEQ